MQVLTAHNNSERIAERVPELLRDYLTKAWIDRAKLQLGPGTRFCEIGFDGVDEFALAKRLELTFDIVLPDSLPWFESVRDLIHYIIRAVDRRHRLQVITSFFRDTWRPSIESYARSGFALIEEINARRPANVLDLGCGDNQFKGRIANLVGLDVANSRADIRCDFLEFDPGTLRFDVILALGSINFGSRQDILDELRHAKSMLTDNGRIYMRVNPGRAWTQRPDLAIYPWNRQNIRQNGADVGLVVLGEVFDDVGTNGLRLSFIYAHDHGFDNRDCGKTGKVPT